MSLSDHCPANDGLGVDALVTRSAVSLAAAMRRGELSPVEVMGAYLRRAHEVRDPYNPFTLIDDEGALAAATAAEARLRSDPGSAGPLAGLPVAVKELTAVAGQQHTLASAFLRDQVADETAPSIQRLLDAGAIVFARTTTPEFGCASITDSLLYGETLNPWDPRCSTAGSSGGAAAALALHATPLAQGTDSAGSLRLPSAACGVVGLKPTFGRVPEPWQSWSDDCLHTGPMARSVDDVGLLLDVMMEPQWAAPAAQGRRAPTSPRGLRVGVVEGMDGLDVDRDVRANLQAVAAGLEDAGAIVEPVAWPWTYERLIETVHLVFASTYGPSVRQVIEAGGEVTDYARAFAASLAPLSDDWRTPLRAGQGRAELRRELRRLLTDHDVLLLPTLAQDSIPAGDHFIDAGPLVEGREQADRWIVGFTVAFNLVNDCPVLALPSGVSRRGMPTGVQLVGRPYDEQLLLGLGRLVESGVPAPGRSTGTSHPVAGLAAREVC